MFTMTSTIAYRRSIPILRISGIVFLLLANMVLFAQQKKITGSVKSPADNKPIQGVNVQVKTTNRGTTTNEKGEFSINADATETLVFSAIGFQTREVKVGEKNEISVQLLEAVSELDNVVVTALGIKREEKALGYSVSKLKGDEFTDAMSNNWTNALSGKVAGLNMIKSGGGPAGSNKIILRGENSLTGNSEALIVLDGVIISGSSGKLSGTGSGSYLDGESPVDFGSSLSDINPEDIQDVTVLKGPGASALYGSRGANGAIIITTKSGKPIQKGLGVTFNSNSAFETINRWPDYQYEYGQGDSGDDLYYSYNKSVDGASTRSTSSAWGPKFDGQMYYQYDPVTRTQGKERTLWVPYKNNRKDFFQTAKTFTNSVTVEGGNAKTNARLSLTNLKNDWIIPNTGYSRNTVALSVTQKVSDKLQISSKVNYANKKSDNLPSTGYNNQTIMYFIRGIVPNADIDWFKDYWVPGKEQLEQTRPFSSLLDNPYLQAYEMLNKTDRHGVIGNVSATYNFTNELSLLVRSALDFSYDSRSQQRPMGTQKFAEGMYRTQNIFTYELNNDFLLRYDRKSNGKFSQSYSAGGSMMKNRFKRDELRADKLRSPGIYNFANTKNVTVAYPYTAEYAVNSFYGMAQWGYDNFLYVDMTGRVDWTSTLATPVSIDNTGFFYPSLNVSAVLSEKLHLPEYISFLKVRGSVAEVGSGTATPYQTSYTYTPNNFPSGLTNPGVIPNTNLKSLRTRSYELGTDIRFLKNRINLDVAVYQNETRNQIWQVPVDRATGYSSVILNTGKIRNRGIEIQANGDVLKNKNGLNWNAFATFASNENKVVELADGIDSYFMSQGPGSRGSIEARPGGRLGALYGIGYERSPDGQIVYNEQGFAVLSENAVYIGNTTPRWKGSFGSEFKYKQFRFNFLVDGQFGGVGYSLTHAVLAEEGKLKKTLPGRYNGIIGDGVTLGADGKYVPNTTIATDIKGYYMSHFERSNVESNTFSTDFIKLREARIDYTFPTKKITKKGIQKASIGIYGRDLFMISEWPVFDPEFGTLGDGEISAGFEVGQFPSTRSFGVSFTLGI